MKPIKTPNAKVFFNTLAYDALHTHLETLAYSKIFILVDENTHTCCLPAFMAQIRGDYDFEIIEIASGEINKNLDTCTQIWEALSELGADRKSVLINLGGGVITDMGGFIAATFKRGIPFINVPTTLLAMVDASVGGKTGIDLGSLKNQIGVILEPEMVVVVPEFLNTLPERQLRSGFAEMLKHGLIQDPKYWKALSKITNYRQLNTSIYTSIVIKANVVRQDPQEFHFRKILNFGHTLGHAIESHFLDSPDKQPLLHGEAIAVGMVLEAYLSYKLSNLPLAQLQDITIVFFTNFKKVSFSKKDIKASLLNLKFDKKNSHGQVKFVLLSALGTPEIDVLVPHALLEESFTYYNNIKEINTK